MEVIHAVYKNCLATKTKKRSSKRKKVEPPSDSARFLGQPDEKPFRSANVAEPIYVLVLDHFAADKLCAVLAEPGECLVDVVYGKHDAQVAQSVHWSVPVISDHRRRDKLREFEPTVAVWRAHHGNLNALVAQSSDAPCPLAFYHDAPFEFEAEFSEKRDSSIEGFHHDADVVHSFKRHVSILYCVVRSVNERRPGHSSLIQRHAHALASVS